MDCVINFDIPTHSKVLLLTSMAYTVIGNDNDYNTMMNCFD